MKRTTMNNFDNNTLRRIWDTELEILQVIDNLCRANDIHYSLAFGSMLGAVRHGGFIPWDDDLDIWMLREDYEKFINIWEKNPVDGYFLLRQETTPSFPQNFSKIRKRNTAFVSAGEENENYHHGIFVDVFPMDNVSTNGVMAKLQVLYAMLYMLFARGYASTHDGKLMYWGSKVLLGLVPNKYNPNVRNFFFRRMTKCNKPGYPATKVMNFATMPDLKYKFEKSWLMEWEDIDFEGKKIMCNKNRNAILSYYFGDFMQFPPEEERVWKHHPVVVDFEHEYWPK